jgi:hypothetical protein
MLGDIFIACSKLEAMVVYVVKQACGHNMRASVCVLAWEPRENILVPSVTWINKSIKSYKIKESMPTLRMHLRPLIPKL